MMTSESGATMGRDTLFGANMIMINFAGGLALFLGGLRHREQTYNFQGTSAFLAVVITLSVLGFILPSYTKATPAGSVTNVQAAGIIAVTLFIYVTFLLIQIGRHKHFFVEPELSENAEAETAASGLAAAIRRRSRNQERSASSPCYSWRASFRSCSWENT